MKIPVRMWAAYMEEPVAVVRTDIFEHWPTHELPVSDSLRQDIEAWDSEYQATLDLNDMAGVPFKSEVLRRKHFERGRNLAARLQRELGDQYVVEYK